MHRAILRPAADVPRAPGAARLVVAILKRMRPLSGDGALAHLSADKVRAAYHRAQYLDERRKLLQAWADMIDAKWKGANVVAIRKKS